MNKREPYKKELSENVHLLYGFRDAHAVVRARLPILGKPWMSLKVEADRLIALRQTFRGALDFGEGKSSLALVNPIEIQVLDDCKVKWGFLDRHLELSLKRFGIWLPPFHFTLEELKGANEALSEICSWAELPQDVRTLQGVI